MRHPAPNPLVLRPPARDRGVNGGYSYVAVFHHNNRLYQIEGKAFVAGGQAEVDAMHFQQSLDFP